MATYKVIQDIEAEDKFLGPLTLKQFIFGSIAAVCAYLCFFLLSRNAWWATIILLPIILVCGFLAFPWGRDQPTEVWLLAKIHYYFKPRRRIWDQTGIQQLVKITAPQSVAQYTAKDFTNTEVKNRLKALADTIDSRGWVIKNVLDGHGPDAMNIPQTDRLIAAETILPKTVEKDSGGLKDIFDEKSSAGLDSRLKQASHDHPAPAATPQIKKSPLWFMSRPQTEEPAPSIPPVIHDEQPDAVLPPVTTTRPTDTINHARSSDRDDKNDGEVIVPLH